MSRRIQVNAGFRTDGDFDFQSHGFHKVTIVEMVTDFEDSRFGKLPPQPGGFRKPGGFGKKMDPLGSFSFARWQDGKSLAGRS